MSKEIIINATHDDTRIALLDQGQLVEFYVEDSSNTRTLGNIILGRIAAIRPSLKAAFVDIGDAQHGFLHFSDLAGNLEQQLAYAKEREPNVASFHGAWRAVHPVPPRKPGRKQRGDPELLQVHDPILVTVSKEPYGTKGPRLTTELSLAGRFLVLLPMAHKVFVSRKISSDKERRRLRTTVRKLLPPGFGVIVRTVANDRDGAALETDLRLLLKRWRTIEAKQADAHDPPVVLHKDVSTASSIIRDLFCEDYTRIVIDHMRTSRAVRSYVNAVAPHMSDVVQLHEGPDSVFQANGVHDQISEVFATKVSLPSGGSLIIERTEAMHVIDVNSGTAGAHMKQKQAALKVNLEAAAAIARQLRLRDLSGLIAVDFIDLYHEKDRQRVVDLLNQHLESDRAVTQTLPMSDFGIVQITRERRRVSITASHRLNGAHSAENEAASPDPDAVMGSLTAWLSQYDGGALKLVVHPFTAAYLERGWFRSYRHRWQRRIKQRIRIVEDAALSPSTFRCLDAATGQEITDHGALDIVAVPKPKRKDSNGARVPGGGNRKKRLKRHKAKA